ncbi:hypothetical protein FNJ84_07260 [Paracoccus sp. M683]|uniref:hypothetical protein n=1 Tax=Paracoccus sp. M683 TaxID=2594268 RepID=UPI00117E8C53|nr:hypothetical protein [Paracoccus sp. M683]TRW97312.1 hypothetical protein FNJ84_07260 [Paracoccus sp. M683]
MSHDQLLAALAPIRLPSAMRDLGWPEMLALLGLGLLLAALIGLILTPLLRRRIRVGQRIRATRGLAPADRLLAIARITGRLPPALREMAYRPAPDLTDRQIERAARRPRR